MNDRTRKKSEESSRGKGEKGPRPKTPSAKIEPRGGLEGSADSDKVSRLVGDRLRAWLMKRGRGFPTCDGEAKLSY